MSYENYDIFFQKMLSNKSVIRNYKQQSFTYSFSDNQK